MAHIVSETRLNWFEPTRDEPLAVSGETGGSGDDLRIEFVGNLPELEAQTKRRLQGKVELAQTLSDITTRASHETGNREIALILGPGSSLDVSDRFATDVRHYRQGRTDLTTITKHVLASVEGVESLLKRLRVLSFDFSSLGAGGTQAALAHLQLVLLNPEDVESAWDTLVHYAVQICKGGRATRKDIRDLLIGRGFSLKPVGVDARWHVQLDAIRELIRRDRPKTAGVLLEDMERELRGVTVGPLVSARLHNYLGVVRLQTDSVESAAQDLSRALGFLPRPTNNDSTPFSDSPAPCVSWADTTINYSTALFALGRNSDAAAALEEVFQMNLGRPNAYGLDARISDSLSKDPKPVPPDIARSADYREHLAIKAIVLDDWEKAVEISGSLIAEGHTPPKLQRVHAQALVNLATLTKDAGEQHIRFLAAERAATTAIERLEQTELDDHLVGALLARAAARGSLGNYSGADEDYARVEGLDPSNPNLIRKQVLDRRSSGNEREALELLTDTIIKKHPDLQLLRALVAGSCNNAALAKADLEEVLARADAHPRKGEMHLEITEVATRVDAFEIAERALSKVPKGFESVFSTVMRARIAFGRGEVDSGVLEYRHAVNAAEALKERDEVLVELAAALAGASRFAESAAVYAELGANEPSHKAFRSYLNALMHSEDYERADAALSRLESLTVHAGGSVNDLPQWALRMGVHIASRQELFTEVVRYGEALASIDNSSESWLHVANGYLKIGEDDAARPILRQVVQRDDLPPELRMTAANLLQDASLHDEALAQSFRALRNKPDDKHMIMNFIGIVLTSDKESSDVGAESAEGQIIEASVKPQNEEEGLSVVTGDTWVLLEPKGADPIEYLIYDTPPVDPGKGEYLVTDPTVLDVVGKARGDIVIRNAGKWNERHYRVKQILPALVHVFRYQLRTFEARFPETPFIQQYHVGDKPTLETLAPIFAAVRSSNQHRDWIWNMYKEQRLPLAAIAKALREPLSHTLATIVGSTDKKQITQAPDTIGLQSGVDTASTAKRVVLSRQAFHALHHLGMLEEVFDAFEVLIPESLITELDAEITEWSEIVKNGRMSMVEGTIGFGLVEVKPGEAAPWLERLTTNRNMLESRGSILPRHLATIGGKNEDWREKLLGPSSFDAIAIAKTNNAVLYADDFGLGVIAKAEFAVDSISTIALVIALGKASGDIEVLDDRTIDLILLNQYFVPIRASTLARVLKKDARTTHLVLNRLSDPELDLAPLIVIVAGALRLLTLGLVTTVSLKEATILMLKALLANRRAAEVIPAFGAVCREFFRLMPNHLAQIYEGTKEVLDAVGVVPTVGADQA